MPDYCREMEKLLDMLDERHIKYNLSIRDYGHNMVGTVMTMERCRFYIYMTEVSVIHGFGSYGGVDIMSGKDEGLLEMMALDGSDEAFGYLTAEDVMERCKKIMEESVKVKEEE